MLIRRSDLEAIVAGKADLAFRRWKRPTVKAGGTLRTKLGVLAIDAVTPVRESDLTEDDARRAGQPSLAALRAELSRRTGQLHRIELHFAGADPRIELRNRSELTPDEVAEIRARLARFDKASHRGPWTAITLDLIRRHPATRAPDLAAQAGWDKPWFKTNVRKLKNLGLTESLKVGYRLSPRGKAFLTAD